MRVKTQKPTRSRAIMVLLMPAIIFLWIVGWSLYWIGHQRDGKRPPSWKASGDTVHLAAIPFEEKKEIVT